jgi:hypothetical protein
VAILAGVVWILALLTRGAKIDVSPQLGCAASGDIREGSRMGRKQAIVKLGEVFGPVAANDVRQFEPGHSE